MIRKQKINYHISSMVLYEIKIVTTIENKFLCTDGDTEMQFQSTCNRTDWKEDSVDDGTKERNVPVSILLLRIPKRAVHTVLCPKSVNLISWKVNEEKQSFVGSVEKKR